MNWRLSSNSASSKVIEKVSRRLWVYLRTTADAVGTNTGTLNNFNFSSISGWVSGRQGTALLFDGADDYVSLDSNLLNLANNFSVSVWIQPRNAAAVGLPCGETHPVCETGLPAHNACRRASRRPTAAFSLSPETAFWKRTGAPFTESP